MSRMMPEPFYIKGRGYLRVRLPKESRHLIGQTPELPAIGLVRIRDTIQKSLGAGTRAETNSRFAQAYAGLCLYFERNGSGQAPSLGLAETPSAAEQAIERWTGARLKQAHDDAWGGHIPHLVRDRAQFMEWRSKRSELLHQLERIQPILGNFNAIMPEFDERLIEAVASQGQCLHPASALIPSLRSTFRRAWIDVLSAETDWSDDINVNRRPRDHKLLTISKTPKLISQFQSPKQPDVTLHAIWIAWVAEKTTGSADNASVSSETVRRYQSTITSAISFFESRNISLATMKDTDVFEWAKHRRNVDNVSPRTINKCDLANLKAILNWAIKPSGGKLISHNPALNVSIPEGQRRTERTPQFYDEEAKCILEASLATKPSDNPTFDRAKRWAPWLCAYSGAQIQEITRLRREDIRYDYGVWLMSFPKTKMGDARDVPFHPHLLAQGVVEMLTAIESGPIFFDPCRHKSFHSGASVRARKMATWVRSIGVRDKRVQPNHAWRHTFLSRAPRCMTDRMADHIVGHKTLYHSPSPDSVFEELAKFPCWVVP